MNDNQWQNNHSNSNNDPYNSIRWRSRVDFPLDLPLSNNDNSVEEVTATNNSGSRSCPQSGEVRNKPILQTTLKPSFSWLL